jgi:hypothetical protein
MQITDQALRVLVLAAENAHGRGDTPVSSYHLVHGLTAGDGGARHALTANSDLRRTVRAASPDAAEAGKRPEFVTAKAVVDGAVHHARTSGRDRATTADLLTAILTSGDDAAALLTAGGADLTALRAALADDHESCCSETGISSIRPILEKLASDAARMPGRARTVVRAAYRLIPYALLYAATLALTWGTSGPELISVFAAGAFLISLPLSIVLGRRRARQIIAGLPSMRVVPDTVQPLLDRLGVVRLDVRVDPDLIRDRCHRAGRRAWIAISRHTESHPEWSPFVLWHEVTHLARRDEMIRRITGAAGSGLVIATLAGFDVRALAITAAGTTALTVADRWWSELACDRIAVRHAGADAIHAWAADHRDTEALARRLRGGAGWTRFKSLLTHPPLALRTALHRTTH